MRDPDAQLQQMVDDLIEVDILETQDNVSWQARDGYLTARLSFPLPDPSVFLDLKKNLLLPKYSFQLVVNGRPVRRFCSNHAHTNPSDCVQFPDEPHTGYHKHQWSDITGDECSYVPTDITPAPIGVAFQGFCDECGVTFGGVWRDPPPTQQRLPYL